MATPRLSPVSLIAVIAWVLWAQVAAALDYVIVPTPPNLVRDDATTLVVDLSAPKSRADYSAGAPDLGLKPESFVDGCYRGPISIPTDKVFGTSDWTIEMVLRLPADTAAQLKQPMDLGLLSVKGNYDLRFGMHPSAGPGFTLHGPSSASRKYPFHCGAATGGDSYTLAKDAPNRWVYLALGFDMKGRRGSAILRDMQGNVLNRNISFFRLASLQQEFAARLPEDQRGAAVAQCWADMTRSLTAPLPPTFTLGNAAMDLRALRISNCFRPEIVYPAYAFSGTEGTPRLARELDPARAVEATFPRKVGYNDYQARVIPVVESYVPLAPGQKIALTLKSLPVGLYSLWLYGTVDPGDRKEIGRVWQPAPMEFEAADAAGKRVALGRLLLKQSFSPRFMQAFSFHVDAAGDYTATLRLAERSMESVRIQQVNLVDCLAALPAQAVKTEQRLAEGKSAQLKEMTDIRRKRDDLIWNAFPPLNIHTLHQAPPPWRRLPEGFKPPVWEFKASAGQRYASLPATLSPLDIIETTTKTVLPHDQVVAGAPLAGPPSDDGAGVFFRKADYPGLAGDMYWCPRAQLMCSRMSAYMGLVCGPGSSGNTPQFDLGHKYQESGDPNTGHDAAMALARIAYDFPALEYGVQDIRLCTHNPDLEFNQNWSYGRGGKVINWSWSADDVRSMIQTYDAVFPYIKDNQLFADELQRFIPWIRTPKDVIALIDRQLVFAAVRDVRRGFLASNREIEDAAGEVLGPGPLTADLFDLTQQFTSLHPYQGPYREGYATGLSRSGSYYTASFLSYALGSAKATISKAYSMLLLKRAGATPPFDLSDVERYPKVRGASDFILDMWVAGGFPFMVGDASGGPHTGPVAYSRMDQPTEEKAFALTGDPRHAWILKQRYKSTDPAVLKAAEGARDPILHNVSRVVPDFGVLLEMTPDEADLTRKTGATFRLGIGSGHAHSDFLDVNFFALGLPVSVDLACRNEGTQTWSRPGASWSFLHNHAVAHDTDDPAKVPGQEGEPWLRAFAPPLLRGSYLDKKEYTRLDRDLLLMQVGDTNAFYAFDAQRLRGGALHTWCFHGCESDALDLNVPMTPNTVRWVDRTLDGTHRTGQSVEYLQATWTMTREARDYAHKFNGGGVVKTVACEPAVLGGRYDAKLPPVRMRATLLGHPGESVMQGNPYSQNYAYCFPFLWVQHKAEGESVYPALYEWYRGDAPVIASARLVSRDPLTVEVVTASGQTDTYTSTAEGFAAVSRDAKGIRWAKVNGMAAFQTRDLSLAAPNARWAARIVDIDYARRALRLDAPLPPLTGALIGNDGRRTWIALKGEGREFTWKDDLLIHRARIADAGIAGPDAVDLKLSAPMLFADVGNRKFSGITVVTEDGQWHFRAGRVVRRPDGAQLTDKVFASPTEPGLGWAQCYEIGIGDTLEVPVDITLRRTEGGYEVQTNAPLTGTISGAALKSAPGSQWQKATRQ